VVEHHAEASVRACFEGEWQDAGHRLPHAPVVGLPDGIEHIG
jgi:hypothetical protein